MNTETLAKANAIQSIIDRLEHRTDRLKDDLAYFRDELDIDFDHAASSLIGAMENELAQQKAFLEAL